MKSNAGWIDVDEHRPSPNHSDRRGRGIEAVTVHATAAGRSSVAWLCDPHSKVSAHFEIERDGTIVQLVSLERAAWHAGVAELVVDGEAHSDVNERTIGIELANYCRYPDGRHPGTAVLAALEYDDGQVLEGWWEPYPEPQLAALERLLEKIAQEVGHRLPLVGHEEIGMPLGRKEDPGAVFPWPRFGRPDGARRTIGHLIVP